MTVRFIGDVHSKQLEYIKVAEQAPYSIQVGDVGFNYKRLESLNSNRHRIVAGNHDNYECVNDRYIRQGKHFLGDFGTHTVPDFGELFFIRGGLSIDKRFKIMGVSWWHTEELNHIEANQAVDAYEKAKPDFVVSHECPLSIIKHVATISDEELRDDFKCILPSRTSKLLQAMWEIHQPKTWIFGHYHKNWIGQVDNTEFICLDKLCYIDFDSDRKHEAGIEWI